MTTIHIEEELNLSKTHFKTMEEFQLYLLMQEKEQSKDYSLSDAHKKIIDDRVTEADANPDNYVIYQEFSDSFDRS